MHYEGDNARRGGAHGEWTVVDLGATPLEVVVRVMWGEEDEHPAPP